MSDKLIEIGNNLKTQDNRITAAPIFIVEKEVIDYGFKAGYADEVHYLTPDYDSVYETLKDAHDDGWTTDELEKIGIKRRWEFVTACFTEVGCQQYIKADGHNIGKSRIFAAGSYRNYEWRAVRDFLLSLATVEVETA